MSSAQQLIPTSLEMRLSESVSVWLERDCLCLRWSLAANDHPSAESLELALLPAEACLFQTLWARIGAEHLRRYLGLGQALRRRP